MQRGALSIAIACFILILINFVLDHKSQVDLGSTRYDLESSRSEQEEWLHRAEDGLKRAKAAFERDIARALALTKEFQDRSRSEAETLEIVRKIVNDLAGDFERLKAAGEAAATPEVEQKPEEGEVKRDTLTDRLMDTSLEKLEAYRNSMRGIAKTYEGQLKFKLLSPAKWEDSSGFIHELEEHYEVQLSDEERTLLQLKFDSYRGIFNTTRAYYSSSIAQKVYEQVEKNGEAAYRAPPPPPRSREEARNVLAGISHRTINMNLMKDENPELYHASMVHPYVAHSLVEEMKSFFEARGGK